MNKVIVTIEYAAKNDCLDDVINSDCFNFDGESLKDAIKGPVYGKSFARYMLLKLDYLFSDSQERMNFNTVSVEHILPQKPDENSRWVRELFSPEQRDEWTDKLGNLVLTTSRKDSELGRLDYDDKRKKHYEKHINTLPNVTRVMGKYATWTPQDLEDNHKIVLKKICEHYGIQIL